MNLNATFIVQIAVFFTLSWFVSRFVWPPISAALDERREKIASGLKAAEFAEANLADVEKKIKIDLDQAKSEKQALMVEAKIQADRLIAEAKQTAESDALRIVQIAQIEVEQHIIRAKQMLREQVASLAIAGAEQILKREVNKSTHADLLTAIKAKL